MDLQALTGRVARLEDLEALTRLKTEYCALCDRGAAGAEVAALFTADAELALGDGAPEVAGPAAIAALYDRLAGRFEGGAHLLANPRLEVDGDRGRGRWWLLFPTVDRATEPVRSRILLAEYDEEYVRVEGAWRIRRLRVASRRWLDAPPERP